MSDNLDDTIQIRVHGSDKLSFIKAAQANEKKPADLLREFIKNYGGGSK